MLIVDRNATENLIEALEALRESPGNARCIHFSLSEYSQDKSELDAAKRGIMDTLFRYHSDSAARLYICANADMYFLSNTLTGKDARLLLEETATHMQGNMHCIQYHELRLHVGMLLYVLERKRQEELNHLQHERRQKEAAQHSAAKLAISNTLATEELRKTITHRRKARNLSYVMIVEDDAFSRRLVENTIGKAHILTSLGSPHEVLPLYTDLAPDILFLDIMLPDVSGHDLLQHILRVDPDAYVVMLSGNADRKNILQAMQNGAKGFIAKPFTREKLMQYIERCPTIQH